MIAFLIICSGLYERNSSLYKKEKQQLENKLLALQKEETVALERRESLKREVESQSDPKWIELTLKRVLGMVEKGEKKWLFIQQAKEVE